MATPSSSPVERRPTVRGFPSSLERDLACETGRPWLVEGAFRSNRVPDSVPFVAGRRTVFNLGDDTAPPTSGSQVAAGTALHHTGASDRLVGAVDGAGVGVDEPSTVFEDADTSVSPVVSSCGQGLPPVRRRGPPWR
jgi:hypothetical protein